MKENFKKNIIISIILVMMVTLLAPCYANASNNIVSGTCGKNDSISWSLDNEGTLTILPSSNIQIYERAYMNNNECPWQEHKDNIKKIVVGERVASLSSNAFQNCNNLQEVELGNSVSYITTTMFEGCNNIKLITVKNEIAIISEDASTLPEGAVICAEKYSFMFYYARKFGRKFKDIKTDEVTLATNTNASYLEALPKTGVENLGIVSTNDMNNSYNNGYQVSFENRKEPDNENYQKIVEMVNEITKNCKTDSDKVSAISSWLYNDKYIKYEYNLGIGANLSSIYKIFFDFKKGNCEAKTMIANYMLYLCGIPTATVIANGHEFSAVFVDGKWDYIDATNGPIAVQANMFTVTKIVFPYKGMVYIVDDPSEGYGGKITGFLKSDSEIQNLKSFKIPNNDYTLMICKKTFDYCPRELELTADIGTIGAKYIENMKFHHIVGNEIIGTNKEASTVKINLNKNEIKLKVGETFQLTANLEPYNTIDYGVRRYISSKTSVATVDYNGGLITAKKVGETTITLTINQLETTCKVIVVDDTPPVTDSILGDVNGDKQVNTIDAVMILQSVAKKITLNANQKVAADVNKDGKIDTLDAVKILQFVAKKISSL